MDRDMAKGGQRFYRLGVHLSGFGGEGSDQVLRGDI